MTAITGEQYYKDHIAEEKEYIPVFAAYPIRKGETLNDGSARRAQEDGYEIGHTFYTREGFSAATIPAADLALPAPRRDLTPEQLADLTPVKKGDDVPYVDHNTGEKFQHTVMHDGFLVPQGNKKTYMSNFDFSDCFNDVANKCHTEADPVTVILKHKATPVKGILIPEDMKLTMVDDEYSARAGSILMDGGHTIDSVLAFNYRLTKKSVAIAAAADAHMLALDNQDQLRNIWLKKKALKAGLAK